LKGLNVIANAPGEKETRTAPTGTAPAPESLLLPETSRKEWLVTLVIFLVSCAYLRLFRDGMTFDPDEGVALQGAARILHGQVLYRDFFSYMTPGSYYWMALLFRIFGSSMLVARTMLVAYGGVFSSLTYLLARRVCARWASLVTTYLLLVSMLPFRFEALHNWDSTLWALLALYGAVLWLQTGHPFAAFASGTFTALTFLFEQSKGACLGLALFIGFAWIAWLRPGGPLGSRSRWMAAAGGYLWPFFVVIGYWAHAGALGQMWNDWLWPLRHYMVSNATSYGAIFPSYQVWLEVFENSSWILRGVVMLILSPCYVIALLPLFGLGALAVCAHEFIKQGELGEACSYDLLVSAVACGAGLSVVIKRADVAQLIFVAPLLFLVAAWIIQRRRVVRWVPAAGRSELTGFLLFSFTLFGLMFLKVALGFPATISTRRGSLRGEKESAALDYLMAHTSPGDKVFIYPYAAHFYFLTDTYSPTPFDYLQPGVHTREQFEEAASEVRADRTPLLFYDVGFFTNLLPESWPATPPEALAEEPLRNLLISSYHPCAVVGQGRDRFVPFWRKDLPCPPNPTH
jgi:hypothetical protein